MTPKVSIPKTNANAGAPTPKSPNILLVVASDILTFPTRDAKGVLLTTDLALKPDAKAISLYATPMSISRTDSAEGDPDGKGWLQTVTFAHPGDSLQINEFAQNALNEDWIIITTECSDTTGTRLHGTPCNPMQYTIEEQDNNEGKKKTFTYTQSMRSQYKSAHYPGELPAVHAPVASGSAGGGV